MRAITPSLLCLMAVLGLGGTTRAELVEMPDYGFSLNFPESWTAEPNKHRQIALTANDEKYTTVLNVSSYQAPNPASAMADAKKSVEDRLKAHGSKEAAKWETGKLGDLPAEWTSAKIFNATTYVYLAEKGGRVYSLNFTVNPRAPGGKLSDEAKQVIASFKALP